jgi:hypothetical protein
MDSEHATLRNQDISEISSKVSRIMSEIEVIASLLICGCGGDQVSGGSGVNTDVHEASLSLHLR